MTEQATTTTKDHGQWYYARHEDSETWSGPFETREDAIAEGRAEILDDDDEGEYDGVFYVCKTTNPPLRFADWCEADSIVERAEYQVADSDRTGAECDEGPYFQVKPEVEKDLIDRIHRACDEWQQAHGLVFTCRTFLTMSRPERIDTVKVEA